VTDVKVKKTDDEWRAELTADQFQVTRQAGTEQAFTGKYWDCKDAGIYLCVCCGSELFQSDTKTTPGPVGRASFRRSRRMPSRPSRTTVSVRVGSR
jgi:peptide-methionine (R)-S-oxide reductase